MLLCGAAVLAALIHPNRWDLGFATLSIRHVERPAVMAAVFFAIYQLTSPLPKGSFARLPRGCLLAISVAWQSWAWNRRAMLAVMIVILPAIALNILRWPVQLLEDQRHFRRRVAAHGAQEAGEAVPAVEGFANRCMSLPLEARILFHGGYEAFLFAYEVYPRRVFMLPEESFAKFAAALHRQRWLVREVQLDERLEPFWTRRLPRIATERDAYLRTCRITHEATFDENRVHLCRVEAVR